MSSENTKMEYKLQGYENFVRINPKSDRFKVIKFHHVEFWCSDASNTYKSFIHSLGMQLIAKSDHSTGNTQFASYVLQSNDIILIFTAPYGIADNQQDQNSKLPVSEEPESTSSRYSQVQAHEFIKKHGLAVKAVGIQTQCATQAYDVSVKNGAKPVHRPCTEETATGSNVTTSEVTLYGDVSLRYVSGAQGPLLPGYTPLPKPRCPLNYGLRCIDHVVGNVPHLVPAIQYIADFTGFHPFAEFTAEDVGTVNSGLNSCVLASNNEHVLLPINEPTHNTRLKSQIQTYLEQNNGAGVQHIALHTADVFATIRAMKDEEDRGGGLALMPRASDEYYKELPGRIGDKLSEQQYQQIEQLGLLADVDDQGVLIQLFTKPIGDRPTIFFEIIQRVGCEVPRREARAEGVVGAGEEVGGEEDDGFELIGGCGGFGKGNFKELFKSIENYEKTIAV